MNNAVSSFYMLGVAEAGMLLQFPFLVREKGALIDRQSLSCISLPQVATGLRLRLPGSFRRRGFQPDQVVYLDDSNLCSCIALFAESGLADGYVPDTAKW